MIHEEKVLDENQWKIEAQAIINDVKNHVQDISISQKLQSTNSKIYLNLTTLESDKYCVKVSSAGFAVASDHHDTITNSQTEAQVFETPYGLLDSISPKYRESFGNDLINKLNNLSN
ncbi:GSCOCG00005874001-RA-CDS [Cotesia congregata]|uniref:Similar to gskip: GSK3-beta interaction protein (Danio rerio) n=1 Tax=Cotesia congregata TaxID=51543 RepID=A0A8J2HQ52_COTCN|nr:GSCOCG00005874001-RA-CDS [Cotesia congregata]CAG5106655.1 Similar to gskip: GSK3-beta interaction protein (Danio rerio) [Cotesia congregata]